MTLRKTAIFGAIVSIASFSFSQEKAVERSELPPAVEKSLQQQLKGATIKGFDTEKEGGRRFYEAQLMVDGRTKDIQFDKDGNVIEVEEEVEMDTLPAGVKASLMTKAGGGRITKVESLMRQNKLVAYEAQVERNGKRSEIQVGPKGEKLHHEV